MQYRNPWGKVRIGRILEDLDSMAGNIAFRHCEDGEAMTLPPMLVTAAVERIHILRPLQLETDFTLRARPSLPLVSSCTCVCPAR